MYIRMYEHAQIFTTATYVAVYKMATVLVKQTLMWLSAAEGLALFKATATNSCGGQATACFRLTACKLCA